MPTLTAPSTGTVKPSAKRAVRAAGDPTRAPRPKNIETYLHRLNQLPVRQRLVLRIRTEIAAGTYEHAHKLDAAIDAMLDDWILFD